MVFFTLYLDINGTKEKKTDCYIFMYIIHNLPFEV